MDPILKQYQSSVGSFKNVKLIFNRNADSEYTLKEFSPDQLDEDPSALRRNESDFSYAEGLFGEDGLQVSPPKTKEYLKPGELETI